MLGACQIGERRRQMAARRAAPHLLQQIGEKLLAYCRSRRIVAEKHRENLYVSSFVHCVSLRLCRLRVYDVFVSELLDWRL